MDTAEFFEKVCRILEEKGRMPEILDYHLPTFSPDLIPGPELILRGNLDYGASEGIYLDMEMDYLTGGKKQKSDLGTFKTLQDDPEAMRIMGYLLADFIVEGYAFIRGHSDGFTGERFQARQCSREKRVPPIQPR